VDCYDFMRLVDDGHKQAAMVTRCASPPTSPTGLRAIEAAIVS